MKKSYIFITIIIILMLIIAYLLIQRQQTIGGQRDSHGCLTAAGYSWNETEQECIREWISDYSRFQVANFQQCIDAGYPVLESTPRQCTTPSGKVFIETLETNIVQVNCTTFRDCPIATCPKGHEEDCPFYECINGKCVRVQNNLSCAKTGEEGDVHGKHCCSGLTSVPINKVPINNTCLEEYPPYGTQFFCINCGNNICEQKENKCNCPDDCS